MVISAVRRECPMQRAIAEYDDMIQTLAANGPDEPFDVGLCHGDRGADNTCLIPSAFTWSTRSLPKIWSRSRNR